MSASTASQRSPEIEELWLSGQVVLVLCGLVASGKSTFAEQLQRHFPRFHRCNQDDLGDRRRVEHLARDILGRGMSVCIDRTNFNDVQRSYWIEIAREFPGTLIWVIVFDTPYEVCAARLQSRTAHPTIKTPEQGLSVLSRFAADFQYPAAHEGHDRIISLKSTEHTSPIYSKSQIAAILRRVHDSPPVIARSGSFRSFRGRHSFRGNSFRRHPVRSDFMPSDARVSNGHGDAVGSMNKEWQTVPNGAGTETNTSEASGHHPGSPEPTTTCSVSSHVTPEDGYVGTGTAKDPFILT